MTAKSEATRTKLLAKALALFQDKGVEGTTMREIAAAAGMSLGAAYYYFPSKDALVFAYYEDNQADMERIAREATGDLRTRLAHLLHAKLETIKPHRKMLGAIIARLIDPSDPLSAFSEQSRGVRDRAIGVFETSLRDSEIPADTIPLVARALWMLMLGLMLAYVNDTTPNESRTHTLVDEAIDLFVLAAPMLGTPMGRAFTDRIASIIAKL